MKTVFEFRRHSLKDGPTAATIGPKGFALAREVGRRQLRGRRFDAFFASDYWRTQQTLAAFGEGAGDFVMKFSPKTPHIYVQSEEVWKMWAACAAAEKRGEDMVRAAMAYDAALVDEAGRTFAKAFLDWASRISPGGTVLIVGHSPHIEILARGLDGQSMPGLKECQGVRIIATDRPEAGPGPWRPDIAIDRVAGDLDPADIRAALFP